MVTIRQNTDQFRTNSYTVILQCVISGGRIYFNRSGNCYVGMKRSFGSKMIAFGEDFLVLIYFESADCHTRPKIAGDRRGNEHIWAWGDNNYCCDHHSGPSNSTKDLLRRPSDSERGCSLGLGSHRHISQCGPICWRPHKAQDARQFGLRPTTRRSSRAVCVRRPHRGISTIFSIWLNSYIIFGSLNVSIFLIILFLICTIYFFLIN